MKKILLMFSFIAILIINNCSIKTTAPIKIKSNEKLYTIAILPVKNNIGGKYSNLVRDYLEIEFVTYSEYQIIDRANIDKLLKEQSLSQLGITKDSSAQIGKYLQADYILISDLYVDNGLWILSGKIIDISTSKVIKASTGKVSSSKFLDGAAKGLARRLTNRM